MSMTEGGGPQSPFTGGLGVSDVVVQLQGIVRQLSNWVQAFTTIFSTRFVGGSFTCAAAVTTTVTEPAVKSLSRIQLQALNAAAGTLQGSAKSLYVSSVTPGSGFTVATANAVAAAGTEQFSYTIFSPS